MVRYPRIGSRPCITRRGSTSVWFTAKDCPTEISCKGIYKEQIDHRYVRSELCKEILIGRQTVFGDTDPVSYTHLQPYAGVKLGAEYAQLKSTFNVFEANKDTDVYKRQFDALSEFLCKVRS